MKVLVVFDHPRRNSFCGAILDAFLAGLQTAGHVAEVADLHAEEFDPRMNPQDEPIWRDRTQVYCPKIVNEQARVDRNDAIAFVFPVWWWSCPSMTKGWIERVWNQGWVQAPAQQGHDDQHRRRYCE